MNRERLATGFALFIGAVWGGAALVSAFTRDTVLVTVITPVMLMAAGFLLGYKGGGGEKRDGDR